MFDFPKLIQMKFLPAFLTIFFVSLSFTVCGQDVTTDSLLYKIETTDGNEYIGEIEGRDAETISLLTGNLGQITLKISDVVSITEINQKQLKSGKYWFPNPQATRYFWAPNGYALEAGEGYYQNIWVLFNQFSVGVTKNFSLGFGFVPLFLFSSDATTPAWIAPKFSLPVEKDRFNMGVGALIGSAGTGFGILYSTFTFGDRDHNSSIGLGWGYADGGIADTPTVSFNYMVRTGPRGYFLTENYYIDTGAGTAIALISLGGRRIIKKIGLDYGFIIPVGNDIDATFVPLLGITAPFGKKN